ncbi:hypothetical protein EST38_g13622 [Candolleomyces aberdarensis]|uniref:NACHT domain-containing protein n=1 Tax=Candolleomyces aberdarensis TaxID=2316362 RepID=A0A4Q2D0I6_9AGAR|nr:hypothetical protein EST38_g13622 [Candolleomyces aberdarensis]
MRRFAVTLASQLPAALPATVPLIEAAVNAEPGLLTNQVSLATQLDRSILSPFQSVINEGILRETVVKGPFLIMIDGLDECEDKQGVEGFIDYIKIIFSTSSKNTLPSRSGSSLPVESSNTSARGWRLMEFCWTISTVTQQAKTFKIFYRSHSRRQRSETGSSERTFERVGPTILDMDKLIGQIGGSFVSCSNNFQIYHPASN